MSAVDVLADLAELIGQAEESQDYCSESGPNESMRRAVALRQIRDDIAPLIAASNEMMRQDAVQRATELTNPFMAGAADNLASALRKVGAR